MGKKAAVLIGCNYPGSKAELKGCVNDVQSMRRCLVDHFGFGDADITVLIDTDDSYTQPTGVNIRRAINRLIRSANPGDELLVHYSGHGTRIPVEPEEEDNTGYHECIVPCDMNLILDKDFLAFVHKLPRACRLTIVADCCNSGGLIENAKEQIGESAIKKSDHEFMDAPARVQLHTRAGEGGFQYAGRFLPTSLILELLKQRNGIKRINEGSIRSVPVDVFGKIATLPIVTNSYKEHWRGITIGKEAAGAANTTNGLSEAPSTSPHGRGILISACQSDQNAADAKPVLRPEGAFGALSNAILSILLERSRTGDRKSMVTNREMVLMVRGILNKQGFTQRPGLYCSDNVVDDPFLFC